MPLSCGHNRITTIDGVFAQISLSPNSALVKDLVETNRIDEIIVDTRGRTSRPSIRFIAFAAMLIIK